MSEEIGGRPKKWKWIILILIFLVTLLILVIVSMKIEPRVCCSCPAYKYELYPISKLVGENLLIGEQICINCDPFLGCSRSFFIIPNDLIILDLLLVGGLIFLQFKRRISISAKT